MLGQAATLEGARTYAETVLERMTRLCYRHQNVRYSAEISRAKEFIRENYADSAISLHRGAEKVGFQPESFLHRVLAGDRTDLCRVFDRCPHRGGKASADQGQQPQKSDIVFDVGYQDSHYFSYLFKSTSAFRRASTASRSEEG